MHSRGWQPDSQALSRAAISAGRCAVDFLYPPQCSFCAAPLPDAVRRPQRLCANCRNGVVPSLANRCVRCSAPVGPHLDTSRGCVHCRTDRFAFERAVSLGAYEGLLRQACLHIKRQTGDVLAAALAESLVEQQFASPDRRPFDLVVPVPHHWTDRILRRHLPPVTLAAHMGRLLSVPSGTHILAKVRRTRPQTELSHAERRRNLRGAFRLIGKPQLKGVRVLLVDDVLTTGTTAHRAATELKRAGAVIQVAVLARGLRPPATSAAQSGARSSVPTSQQDPSQT